jgi:hypothetical protein
LDVLGTKAIAVPAFDWESHSQLQKALAENYVSVMFGVIDSAALRELAKAGKLGYREFFTASPSIFSQQVDLPFSSIEEVEKVILAVFVPSHKPLNQFGMDPEILAQIQQFAKTKACILVHFGNPLALKHLGRLADFEAVVCAYQGFVETQVVTASLMVGKSGYKIRFNLGCPLLQHMMRKDALYFVDVDRLVELLFDARMNLARNPNL